MGFEILTQPQVFLSPITAVGGIQNGLFSDPLPPLYTSFYTWTSTSSVTATTFPLGGFETLTNRSGSYIVTVGGVVQSPTNYTVDPNTRNLTFDFNVNADTPVVVTQIGTIATSALNITDLTATNSTLINVTAINSFLQNVTSTNLRVLSSQFFGTTVFDTVTATRLIVLSATTQVSQTIVVPTSVVNLTAVNSALFLGPISATNPVLIDTSSTNTALRVTQTGSGDALIVEDSTNPDATPFVVKADGRVGIGTTAPAHKLTVSGTGVVMGFDNGAAIYARNANNVDEIVCFPRWSDDRMYVNIGLSGLNVRSNSDVSRIVVDSAGKVGIGTTAPNELLTVAGNVSSIGTVYASGGNSNTWNYNTTLLQANSANWNSTYATVSSLSSFWEESADITAITTVVASNSANWDTAYATTTALSSNLWNDVYTTVQSSSASWEESTDILPTVTNYLSTSNVILSGLTTESITVTSNNVFGTTSFVNTVSALAITVNGTVLYLPLLSAV